MTKISVVLVVFSISVACAAQDVLLSKSYVVVTDRTSNSVLRFETDGTFKDKFVQAAALPESVVFGPDQNLYISSFQTGSVERFNGATGNYIGRFASGPLVGSEGLTFGPDGNLYVVDRTRSAVLRFDGGTGTYIDDFVRSGSGGYNNASGITFGPDGNLYVTSGSPSQSNPGAAVDPQILRFNGRTGAFIDVFVRTRSGGLNAPFTLIFGPDKNLYVSSVLTDSVLRYNGASGEFIDAFVRPNSGGLSRPTGLRFGPDGNLYVASAIGTNVGILRYNGSTGAFIDTFIKAGTGGLSGPTGVLFYTFESLIAGDGRDTTVAAQSNGTRLVGWIENGVVKVRTFDASGKSTQQAQSLTALSDGASHPKAVATGAGTFLTIWLAKPPGVSSTRVYGLPLSPDGTPLSPPREITSPPPNTFDDPPAFAALRDKAAVCWSRRDVSGRGTIMARLIDVQSALPSGGEVSLSSTSDSSNEAPVIASDSNDRLVIAWTRRNLSNSTSSIYLGSTTASLLPFQSRVIDDGAAGDVGNPSISANPSGVAMVAWPSAATTSTAMTSSNARPAARRVRIRVLPVGMGGGAASTMIMAAAEPFTVNSDELRGATSPQVTVDASGMSAVVWQYDGLLGGTGIYGRAVNINGVVDKSDFVVFDAADSSETFSSPASAVDVSGTLTISSHKSVAGTTSVFTRTRTPVSLGSTGRRRSVKH